MASNEVYFVHPKTGIRKTAPVGYSWTTLFFGPFPMLFRKKIKWFLLILLASIFTYWLVPIVLSFMINKLYIKSLVAEGFDAVGVKYGSVDSVASILGVALPVAALAAMTAVVASASNDTSNTNANVNETNNTNPIAHAITNTAKDMASDAVTNAVATEVEGDFADDGEEEEYDEDEGWEESR